MLFAKILIVYFYIGLLVFGFYYFNVLFRSVIKKGCIVEYLKKNPSISYKQAQTEDEWEIEADLSDKQLAEIEELEKAVMVNMFILMLFVWPIFFKMLKETIFPSKKK